MALLTSRTLRSGWLGWPEEAELEQNRSLTLTHVKGWVSSELKRGEKYIEIFVYCGKKLL